MKLTLPLTLFIVVMKWRSLLATDPQCINSVCQANMGEQGFNTIQLTRLSTSYTLQCPFRISVSQWDIRRRSDDDPVSIPHSASLDITLNNVNASDEGFYRCHTVSNDQPVIAPARCILILATGDFTSPDSESITVQLNGDIRLDTRVVFQHSGPCGFLSVANRVTFERMGDATSLFSCALDESNPTCQNAVANSDIVTVPQGSSLTGNNFLNFNLFIQRATYNWSGEFLYTVSFNSPEFRQISKTFTINVTAPPPTTPPSEETTGPTSRSTSVPTGSVGGSNTPQFSQRSVIGISVGIVLAAIFAVAVVVVVIVIIWRLRYSNTSGRVALKEVRGGDKISPNNGLVHSDGLVVDNSYSNGPKFDTTNGRPTSIVDNYPGNLPESRESEEFIV